MDQESPVVYSREGRLAKIRLNRPNARNALNAALNRTLAEAWDRFESDDFVDVAVLSGEGASFSGAVLETFIPQWGNASFSDLRSNVAKGIARGGGFELALACDIRVAARSARFGVFEVRAGLHQGDGGLTRPSTSRDWGRA